MAELLTFTQAHEWWVGQEQPSPTASMTAPTMSEQEDGKGTCNPGEETVITCTPIYNQEKAQMARDGTHVPNTGG